MKGDTAQIFLLDLQEFGEMEYRQFYKIVSSKRRGKAERYCKFEDALRCVMSEILVRYAYRHICKNTESVQLVYPPQRKPYLSNDTSFHFSISHAGRFVAVGYAKEELGIDIEQVHRPLDCKKIANLVFTPEEQAYIYEVSEEERRKMRFMELWTAKESYLKYLGCGFKKSPMSFSVMFGTENRRICEKRGGVVPYVHILGSYFSKGYYLSVCGNVKQFSLTLISHRSILAEEAPFLV